MSAAITSDFLLTFLRRHSLLNASGVTGQHFQEQFTSGSISILPPVRLEPLFHICDLYDTALCLRVLWILYHGHVQFFLAFAEGDVGCPVTGGDLKYV